MAVYGILVWLAYGLLTPSPLHPFTFSHLLQLASLALSTFLMVVLNNSNALIRTYSRTASATFIALNCMLCFLFDSLSGAIVGVCILALYLCAFRIYQDKQSPGWAFYAFLCLGFASLLFPVLLLFIPVFWLFMRFQLNSLSWRTFLASLLGLLTPYWFLLAYMLWQNDFSFIQDMIQSVEFRVESVERATVIPSADGTAAANSSLFTLHSSLYNSSPFHLFSYLWITILTLTGIIHFWRHVLADKIRTRQFYGCFIWMSLLCIVAIPLLPQHFDPLIRLLIINASPLIAHFLTLTHTRITDIAFKVICVITLLLTLLNLWTPSLTF